MNKKQVLFGGEVTYTWSEDNSTCTATRTALSDPTQIETETKQATIVGDFDNDKINYTVCFDNEAFEDQIKSKNYYGEMPLLSQD